MSRRYHRLRRLSLRRPSAIRQWPAAGIGLILFLSLVVILAAILSLLVRPDAWPTNKAPGDQWAALGVIFGAGAFLLAVLATVVATVAYINSTEKPQLAVTARPEGWDPWLLRQTSRPDYRANVEDATLR